MYNLIPSMMTGIAQVDDDHHDLVAAINLIENAEKEASLPDVLKLLRDFRNHLATHFTSEELYLRMLKYPGIRTHAEHHSEIITGLDRMQEDVVAGTLVLGDIAAQCFHELMNAVITMDLRFLNWYEENKRRH